MRQKQLRLQLSLGLFVALFAALAFGSISAPTARAASALVVYPLGVHATTLPGADALGANTATSETGWSGWAGGIGSKKVGWCQFVNSTGACTPTASLGTPAPTGTGMLLDSTLLEGQTIAAGAWSGADSVSAPSSLHVSYVARYWVRHSNGTYTAIGQSPETATITGNNAYQAMTIPAVTLAATALATGDKLYIDYWYHVSSNTASRATSLFLQTSDMSNQFNPADKVTTPGYSATGGGGGSPAVGFAPSSLAFGNQTVNTSSAPQAVTLTNTGTAALNISGIALGGANANQFSQTNNCPASLGAGLNCAINVTFSPTVVQSDSASVQVTDDAAGSPQSVPLTGAGVSGGGGGGTTYTVQPTDSQATIDNDLRALLPGDTLQFATGTYTTHLRLDPNVPTNVHGTASAPITIKAQNDGGATLNGGGTDEPFFVAGSSYVVFQGFAVENSSTSVVRLFGSNSANDHLTLQRITAHGANAADNWHDFENSNNSNILIEDSAAWGPGRYNFDNYHSAFVTLRRDFAFGATSNWPSQAPRCNFSVYGSHDVSLENDIGIGTVPTSVQDNYYCAVFQTSDDAVNFPTTNVHYYGDMFYNDCQGFNVTPNGGNSTTTTWQDMYLSIPANSTCQADLVNHYDPTAMELESTHAMTVKGAVFQGSQFAWENDVGTDAATFVNSVFANNATAFGSNPPPAANVTYSDFNGNGSNGITPGATDTTAAPGYNTATYGSGAYLMPAPSLPGKGQNGGDVGAHITYQYQNGVLTNTPLWPWPMESRINAELGRSVTFSSGGGIWNTLSGVYPASVPNMDHVFVVLEENHAYNQIVGDTTDAPYINNTLLPAGASGGNYFAVTHPSLPNYLALTAGQTFGIADDNPPSSHQLNAANLAGQLEAVGKTWKAYQETMPSNCDLTDSGNYAVKHNPFAYYTNLSDCSSRDVPYTQLATDLANGAAPSFAFITPNLVNDMHDGTISQGDSWLANNLPNILNSSACTQQHCLVVVVWDEDDSSGTNQVPMILRGYKVKAGFSSTTQYNHYALLRTLEASLAVGPMTGNDGGAATMSDLFNP